MEDDGKFDEFITEERSGILALKLSSCEIDKRLPKFFFDKLPSLLCLIITTPGLKSLEKGDFTAAADLQFLYLPGNRIQKILNSTFEGAPNLNDINLSDNEIQIISDDALNGLDHLESLNLSRNNISFINQATFSTLNNLINLDLSGNIIEFLDARLFMYNKKLNVLNMADNQILSITSKFLFLLPQLKVFNVMNNPCTNDEANFQNDENSLNKCFENFLKLADNESTDFEDLLDKANIVQEDIEETIINDLNMELRKQDVLIEELKRSGDLFKIAIVFVAFVIFFFVVLKTVISVVNSMYLHDKNQNDTDLNVENITVGQKQVVYTIEV
jgi:hypothetical protein